VGKATPPVLSSVAALLNGLFDIPHARTIEVIERQHSSYTTT
jgi:hypothetical protein